jgi:hypothetical protein
MKERAWAEATRVAIANLNLIGLERPYYLAKTATNNLV